MRKIKEILRLHFVEKLSNRAIATSVAASASTVAICLHKAKNSGISWPLDDDLDDTALEAKLYSKPPLVSYPRVPLDLEYIHNELRHKGVTLHLLWQEYKQANPQNGYQYSRFCELYTRFRKNLDVALRQTHRAGEKMFVDFSGDGIDIVNPKTGEVIQAEVFVAVLGASNYTYSEAFESQQLHCWIQGHIHAYEFFQGVAEITVPDNTRTGVTHPCRYDPDLNPTYLHMANHYGTAIIPARVRKPKDKAKAENAVLTAQRWILAALRNHTFFSIEEANQAIAEKLTELNLRKFQKLDTNRQEQFELIDKPALKPLPQSRFEYAEWASPRVNIDYHVEVDKHYYSVPYQMVRKKLEARITSTTVEFFFKGERVASHRRSFVKGSHSTLIQHMPKSHREYVEWTPQRIRSWAAKTGPMTAKLAEMIMASKKHPQQGFRACLGVMRLGKRYGNDRLEAACERALLIGAVTYKSVKSILKKGLDRQPLPKQRQMNLAPIEHDNIRGPEYYQ
jgi:transposase